VSVLEILCVDMPPYLSPRLRPRVPEEGLEASALIHQRTDVSSVYTGVTNARLASKRWDQREVFHEVFW
jgi:hypothetical protein